MNFIVLVPRVMQSYKARFPEMQRNAYPYFNYDNRVVEESVPRGDVESSYKGPDDFSDMDYDALVKYAQTLLNPILEKYSHKVACEDALNMAIRSFNNGMFDNKVNAGRYCVLLESMLQPRAMTAKKKEKKEVKDKEVKFHVLRQLGIKRTDVPKKERTRVRKGLPALYREKGKIVVHKEGAVSINDYLGDFLSIISSLPTRDMDVVRRLVGRWPQVKPMVKEFLQDCLDEGELDAEYVKKVSEDFKEASALIDKLERMYEDMKKFDMEGIKTYVEPFQALVEKIKSQSSEQQPSDESAAPVDMPAEEQPVDETQSLNTKESCMLKNAKEYTERLDKIAEDLQGIDPVLALQVDMISDVIEGRREASTLKFDSDEARYMANRFDMRVRSRESDEPYMDDYNKSNFEQVIDARKKPEPVKKASVPPPYQKVQ